MPPDVLVELIEVSKPSVAGSAPRAKCVSWSKVECRSIRKTYLYGSAAGWVMRCLFNLLAWANTLPQRLHLNSPVGCVRLIATEVEMEIVLAVSRRR